MRVLPGLVVLSAGLALLSFGLAPVVGGVWGQRDADRRWHQIVSASPPPVAPPGPSAQPPGPSAQPPATPAPDLVRPVDGFDFRLTVPRIGYSEVVREGVSLDVLALGPGHYPQTAWPGQPGNVGVAAHNVYWLRFVELKPGDGLQLETRYGDFRYRVTGSRVVSASDSWVLEPAPERHLTLTTCWPVWAGQFAAQRLVIFASQEAPPPPAAA